MSLFERLMKPAQQAQPVQQEQPTQQPTQQAATQEVPANTTVPTGEASADKSPLAAYDKMWETTDNKGNEAPSFVLDNEAVNNMSKQINFSNNINKEQLAAVANGGEGAIEAMLAMLNTTAQNTFNNATQTTGHLISKAMERNNAHLAGTIPTQIKQATVSDSLAKANPSFTDPAVAPLLKMVEQQLLLQFPNASAEELTTQAQGYLSGLATMITPAEVPEQTKQEASQDFSNYLN